MKNKPKRVNVSFGDLKSLDEDIKSFYGYIFPIPKDGVEVINVHLMHGIFQLLRTKNKVWGELKTKKYSDIAKSKTSSPSATSNQPNLQTVVDCANFVICCIANEMDEIIDEETMKSYILGLIGYSIQLVEDWKLPNNDEWDHQGLYCITSKLKNHLDKCK